MKKPLNYANNSATLKECAGFNRKPSTNPESKSSRKFSLDARNAFLATGT
jgi:hypothetical protein